MIGGAAGVVQPTPSAWATLIIALSTYVLSAVSVVVGWAGKGSFPWPILVTALVTPLPVLVPRVMAYVCTRKDIVMNTQRWYFSALAAPLPGGEADDAMGAE